MTQPDELKKDEPLVWSSGRGTDVWNLFCACTAGALEQVRRLLTKDPALVRCQFHYRKPLYFAVRENQLAVTEFLLERDPNPVGLAVNDSLLDIARDRGYVEMENLLTTKLAARHDISAKAINRARISWRAKEKRQRTAAVQDLTAELGRIARFDGGTSKVRPPPCTAKHGRKTRTLTKARARSLVPALSMK